MLLNIVLLLISSVKMICFVFTVLFLSWEYVYFIIFIIQILSSRSGFDRIEIVEIDMNVQSIPGLWAYYCRIQAFIRLHNMLSKKKISFKTMLYSSIIYLLSIPIRSIRIIFYFIKSKENFRDSMTILCFDWFKKVENRKIEILDGEIYINCFTLRKLLINDSLRYKKLEDQVNFIKDLRSVYAKYHSYDEDKIKLHMISFKTKEGREVNIKHPGIFNGSIVGNATNWSPQKLLPSQKCNIPVKDAVSKDHSKPAFIISYDTKKMDVDWKKFVWVSKTQLLASIYDSYNELGFIDEDFKKVYHKREDFYRIFVKHGILKEERVLRELTGLSLIHIWRCRRRG